MPDKLLRLIYTEHGLSASKPDLAVCNTLARFFSPPERANPYFIAREPVECAVQAAGKKENGQH